MLLGWRHPFPRREDAETQGPEKPFRDRWWELCEESGGKESGGSSFVEYVFALTIRSFLIYAARVRKTIGKHIISFVKLSNIFNPLEWSTWNHHSDPDLFGWAFLIFLNRAHDGHEDSMRRIHLLRIFRNSSILCRPASWALACALT